MISPLLRSIAVTRPYGGFNIGNPSSDGGIIVPPRVYSRLLRSGFGFTSCTTIGLVIDGTYKRAGLRIERRARPVRAAGPTRILNRAFLRRRREERTVVELLEHLERGVLELRREVDQIASVTPCRSNAGGLVGNGCVGCVRSPGTVDCGTGRSSIGHTGAPVRRSKT